MCPIQPQNCYILGRREYFFFTFINASFSFSPFFHGASSQRCKHLKPHSTRECKMWGPPHWPFSVLTPFSPNRSRSNAIVVDPACHPASYVRLCMVGPIAVQDHLSKASLPPPYPLYHLPNLKSWTLGVFFRHYYLFFSSMCELCLDLKSFKWYMCCKNAINF